MAGNAKIKVTLGSGIVAELDEDAPNVKEFVNTITTNRASIELEKIRVEGPTPEFDAESFKEIIVEVVTDYLDAISIEEKAYLKAIGKKETSLENSEEETSRGESYD